MISNSERIRIRRQMQRRIRDVVAERRRARQADPGGEVVDEAVVDARADSSLVCGG